MIRCFDIMNTNIVKNDDDDVEIYSFSLFSSVVDKLKKKKKEKMH